MDNRTIDEVRRNEDRLINKIELLERENQDLKEELKKYQQNRETNTKKYLELQNYIKSRIQYCEEITGFDCCIEELEEIQKRL